jgi:hypothetical protein
MVKDFPNSSNKYNRSGYKGRSTKALDTKAEATMASTLELEK